MIPIWNGTLTGNDWFPYWDIPLGQYQHFPLGFILVWGGFFALVGILCYLNFRYTEPKKPEPEKPRKEGE